MKRIVFFIVAIMLLSSCQKEEIYPDASISPLASAKKVKVPAKVRDVDNNWYNTVTIGTQVWLTENLKTTRYNNKVPIPFINTDAGWRSTSGPAYCWYGDDPANKEPYGAMYNWYAVNMGNLCPIGWHVPSEAEWTQLIEFLDPSAGFTETGAFISYLAGDMLKEAGNLHWEVPSAGTNVTGFTGLPGGYRFHNWVDQPTCINLEILGSYWSTTEYSPDFAWDFVLFSTNSNVVRDGTHMLTGCSVRCLKD